MAFCLGKATIDPDMGGEAMSRRCGTGAQGCGTLRGNTHLDRCTLRGRRNVDEPWKRYCLTHNIEQLVHHGYVA